MSNEWGWEKFSIFFRTYLETHNIQEVYDTHIPDLTAQVATYKESIKLGHGVIVVAHSQGNYFTNEAYELLDGWMKDYFHMFGVATPANHVAGFPVDDAAAPYVLFHNDFINFIATALPSNLDDTRHHGFPSTDAHDFYESYMKEETSKKMITDFIIDEIQKHSRNDSQWELDQELNKGTKDFKITLKHRFDTTITSMQDVEVYPFKASEKLYHVKDNTPDGNGWVKASCGGEEVFNSWPTQKDGEEYLINNPEKEIIISKVIPKIIGIKFNINRAGTQNHTGRVPVMIPSYISDLDKLLSSSYGNSPDSTLAVVYTVSYHTWVGAHGLILHDFFNPTFTGSYYKLKEHNFNTSYRVMTFRTYSKEYMDKYPLYFYINNESISIHSNFLDKYNFDFNNVGTFMVGSLIDDYSYYQSYINASYNFKDIDLKI